MHCLTCVFFKHFKTSYPADGTCTRYPPTVWVNAAGEAEALFPLVFKGWSCGEFREAPDGAA